MNGNVVTMLAWLFFFVWVGVWIYFLGWVFGGVIGWFTSLPFMLVFDGLSGERDLPFKRVILPPPPYAPESPWPPVGGVLGRPGGMTTTGHDEIVSVTIIEEHPGYLEDMRDEGVS